MKSKLIIAFGLMQVVALLEIANAQSRASVTDLPPLRIHIIAGAKEYNSAATLRKFADELNRDWKVEITASWTTDHATRLENLESLNKADLLILYARRLSLDKKAMTVLKQHWQQGKPVVGIRTASHAFDRTYSPKFDQEVFGNNYQGHFGDEPYAVSNRKEQISHPLLQGVTGWTSRKLYKAGPLAKGTAVLQEGNFDGKVHPVTLTHKYKNTRMFYTSLGVPEDFETDSFRQLLRNAICWTTERDPSTLVLPAKNTCDNPVTPIAP